MTRPGAAPVRLLTITAPAVGVVRANSRFAFDANRQGDLNRPSLRFGLVLVRHVAREAQGDRSPSGRRENNDRSPTPEKLQSPHRRASQQWHPQSRREERDQRLEEPRWRRMFGGATPTLPRCASGWCWCAERLTGSAQMHHRARGRATGNGVRNHLRRRARLWIVLGSAVPDTDPGTTPVPALLGWPARHPALSCLLSGG